MSVNKRILVAAAAVLTLGASSCRKYLDVNTNPNISTTATVKTLLPASELLIGTALGCDLQINGGIWAGYWTQSPNASQYRSLEQYSPGQDAYTYPWANLYSANENLFQLAKLAETQKKRHYVAIALMLQAYTYQLITDGFGDAPFTQASKALPVDGGILAPKYDSQRVIYAGIIKYIDSAEALLKVTGEDPGSDDLMYGGSASQWEKFGYTLKLKAYIRLSKIDPIWAQNGIAAMYADPAVSFIGIGDDARIKYGFNTSNKNPLYAEASSTTMGSIQNLVGSSTCIDSMNSNNDYRSYVFYEALSSGVCGGIPQGAYDIVVASNTYSIPNVYVAGDAQNAASKDAPVNFLTSWESYFLQAEAVARGWATGSTMTDDELFYMGDSASFNYYSANMNNEIGFTGDAAFQLYYYGDVSTSTPPAYWATYPSAGTVAQKIRHIATAKWFAMCGNQGFEAWVEMRRTGYPDFFVPSRNSLIGTNLPKRFLYPTTESTRNAAFPGLAPITSKMWWDL